MATLLLLDEKETILDLVYSSYDTEELQGLSPVQLQSLYENLRYTKLSIPQIKASMSYTCACPSLCDREEILDVLQEMDRRFFLAQDLQWEFALLDRQRKGAISKSEAKFLFQMVHGDFFSKYRFERLMQSRVVVDSDITFEEIEVELCNIPTHDWIDELLVEEEREKEERAFQRREAERKRKEMEEQQRREEEMKQQLEEEDRKMKMLLAKRKLEEEENQKKQEEEKKEEEVRKAQEEEMRKQREEELRIAEEEAKVKVAKEAELLKAKQLEEEKQKKEEQERVEVERERHRILEAEEEERMRVKEDEDKKLKEAEEERMKEEAEKERLRIEEEASKAAAMEVEKAQQKTERALQNWKKAKATGLKKIHQDRVQALHEAKARREAEEALMEEENAGAAEEQEEKAEEELQQAEAMLLQATTEEERKKAEAAREKAQKKALKNREKRLRLSLRAAVKQRFRPKIDATVVEAKDAEIPALNPDIEKAEKVSDSIKCGEELEDAMVKRNLSEMEGAVEKIKSKGYEKEHTVQLLDADKLMQKLRRLEKLKKEIMALDQRTISEIRSYKTPIPAIHEVMIATYIILGYKEKELKEWKFIQALLGRSGKEGLKRMCTTLDATKMDLNLATVADKKYLSKHDLGSITDVSAGAATFFVWSTAMIDEARSWNEDSEFRKKIEEKRRLEEEEAKRLQEEKENARASKKKKNTSAPRNAGEDKNARAVSTGKSSGSKPEKVKKEKGASSRAKTEVKGTPPASRKKSLTPAKSRARSSSPKAK